VAADRRHVEAAQRVDAGGDGFGVDERRALVLGRLDVPVLDAAGDRL
jgi:hypothetical protein